jgi:hypothetical protein
MRRPVRVKQILFCSSFSFDVFHRQGSPFAPIASVATLPSAVIYELSLLAASWVFLVTAGAATCLATSVLSRG